MNVMECDNRIKSWWANSDDICDDSLAFQSKDGYSVQRKVAGSATATVLCKEHFLLLHTCRVSQMLLIYQGMM